MASKPPASPVPRQQTLAWQSGSSFKPQNRHGSSQWNSVNGCLSPGGAEHLLSRHSRRKQSASVLGSCRAWLVQHQAAVSLNVLLVHAIVHSCIPSVRSWSRSFIYLSYYDHTVQKYNRGPNDLYFVTYWIVLFSALRAVVMQHLLIPLTRALNIQKSKTRVRFAEQAWLLVYYVVFWPLGMYLMSKSKYWFNLREMWTDFPTRSMDGLFKWYYLAQFAFWLQQILVINLEERRKDHWQMFTHHIVTCLLISMSYGYYHTKVGNVILCIMDQVDLVFSTAKMLKYAGYQTACDIAFGVFIFSWFMTRHVCYLIICWSIYADVPKTIPYGCYSSIDGIDFTANDTDSGGNEILRNILQSFIEPDARVCFNRPIHYTFLGLLLVLQGITVVWFGMILRVAWRVINGAGADDSRSDDEEEEEEEEEEEVRHEEKIAKHSENVSPVSIQPLEECVGVEALHFKKKASPLFRNRKSTSHSGGITIPGHSDRKELLGRIGCDKPS